MNEELIGLLKEYGELLDSQQFDESALDYAILNYHIGLLERLDVTGSSCISIFDLHKRKHLYLSRGYNTILGWDIESVLQGNQEQEIDERTHPEDRINMTRAGLYFLKLAFAMPVSQRKECKLIAEYRILNKTEQYIKVIEQFQAIELDRKGNTWLALCILDISPEQDIEQPFKCRALNFKTGEVFDLPSDINEQDSKKLSGREKEILAMIAQGKRSKEIAEELFISIHTVNTHRQRILEKLGAENSPEAIRYAHNYKLI